MSTQNVFGRHAELARYRRLPKKAYRAGNRYGVLFLCVLSIVEHTYDPFNNAD